MAIEKVVKTVYGNYSIYEIVKKSGLFSTEFYIKKDGKVVIGGFKSVEAAVKWAEKKG